MQAQSVFVTYFEFMKHCSETCFHACAAQKIDVGFNYSWDYYESEAVWQCVTVCVTLCVCAQYYSCVDPGDSSTAERSFDQPKATWKEKLWIMLESVDTVGKTHTHTLDTYTVAALVCHGLSSDR